MHQLACGVDETIIIDGYMVKVLEVTDTEVRFGLSIRGDSRQVHEISIPRAGDPQTADAEEELTTR